ncbi:unnamed protein product [Effrenium voratum]|uniref:J domain-containing protein n=1 Tax=Effrenium voratum TaxID=2562239 RepID=A0AA36HRY6_9DINO|nr:unnamed protein product [Effrenium voratum]
MRRADYALRLPALEIPVGARVSFAQWHVEASAMNDSRYTTEASDLLSDWHLEQLRPDIIRLPRGKAIVWDVKSSEEVCTYFDKRLGEGQDEPPSSAVRQLLRQLDLPTNASKAQIRAAYLRKVKVLHPDVAGKSAEESFCQLKEEYEHAMEEMKQGAHGHGHGHRHARHAHDFHAAHAPHHYSHRHGHGHHRRHWDPNPSKPWKSTTQSGWAADMSITQRRRLVRCSVFEGEMLALKGLASCRCLHLASSLSPCTCSLIRLTMPSLHRGIFRTVELVELRPASFQGRLQKGCLITTRAARPNALCAFEAATTYLLQKLQIAKRSVKALKAQPAWLRVSLRLQ